MHSCTLITTLVLVAAHWITRVGTDGPSELDKRKLANKLNTLLHHPGWRLMDNIKITNTTKDGYSDPMSAILEAIAANRSPVDESNVLVRHKEILSVLMCKYAEIILKYRILVNHLIRICRDVICTPGSCQRYDHCFRLLLIKLHSMSPRFKCMADALDLIHSLGPQSKRKYCMMTAIGKLTEFTSTLMPETLSKLSGQVVDETVVDRELKTIGDTMYVITKNSIYKFAKRDCDIPTHKDLTIRKLFDDMHIKKHNRLIPDETTISQYLADEIDFYINGILGEWFFDLGFRYEVEGKVIIGII